MAAAGAFLCAAILAPGAQALNGSGGSGGAANKYFGVTNVSWHGLQISLWTLPGVGIRAYRVTAPIAQSSDWRFCETPSARDVEQCIGAAGPPPR
jgi:hypothetical protein